MFWIVLAVGVVSVLFYKKINPDGIKAYFLYVLFIEIFNALLFWPFGKR